MSSQQQKAIAKPHFGNLIADLKREWSHGEVEMSKLRIVRATRHHLEPTSSLFDQYRQFYNQRSDLVSARGFLKKRMDRRESVLFLALVSGHVVGFAQLYPTFSSLAMKRVWILNDLFVTEGARGRGVATALLKRAKRLAETTKAKGLMLETARTNANAQSLYEKLGWKRNDLFYTYSLDVKSKLDRSNFERRIKTSV